MSSEKIETKKIIALVIPAPLLAYAFVLSIDLGIEWNIHGNGAAAMVGIALIAIGCFSHLLPLTLSGAKQLISTPKLRTFSNLASVSLGIIYIGVCTWVTLKAFIQ